MTMKKLTPIAMALGMLTSGQVMAGQELIAVEATNYKADIAQILTQKLQSPAFKKQLLAQLSGTKQPLLFSNIMGQKLQASTQTLLDQALNQGIHPEVWLHNPNGQQQLDKLLIAYAPAGDEKQWQSIPAIDLASGEQVQLDVNHAPERPVLVVETHGLYSMQNFVNELNVELGALAISPSTQQAAPQAVVPTTKLTKISLQNDEEPWIKGAAEIFTFVAGVFDQNKPAIKAVGLPYLDYDKTDYYPNQLIINWNDYKYNAVNFSMYEEDSQTNYKTLAKAIVTAVGAIGSLAGFEPAVAIATITNRIQDAMPDSWYTDDHDYVDTCYTIVKGASLDDQWCAGRNAKISVRPFDLQSN